MPEKQRKQLTIKMKQSATVIDSHVLSEGKKAKNSKRTSNNTSNKITPRLDAQIINV